MKKFKRILSQILVLTMILSSFSFVIAFGAVYETPENFDEMTGLLSALDIIDETFSVNSSEITRKEFTKLVVKASGLGDFVSANVTYPPFTDVDVNNEYAPYVELAKSKNLTYGYSDGTFKPEESISLTEAIVYLIRLLGYTDIAEEKGGYPGGYQTLSYTIDLMKSIKIGYDDFVTNECAVNLIFNALNANVLMIDSISSDSYKITAGQPLMYQNFKVVKKSGITEGVDITSLVGPNDVKPFNIMVDGSLIDVGNLSPNDFLGYNVNVYYHEGEEVNTLKFIAKNKRNKEEIINISEITSISDYTVYKTDMNGKQKIYSYERGASVIYNGTSTTSAFNMSIFNDLNGNKLDGNIKLLDNNGDSKFDVIFVNVYEEFIVGKIDSKDKMVYDYNNTSNNIKLDTTVDDPYTVIYDENGEEISLGKLNTGSSVMIYRSKPDAYQKYIRVYVSQKTISGLLSSVGYDELNNLIARIGNKEYKLTGYANKYYSSKLLGSIVTAYMNINGEVTFIKEGDNSNEKWGILTAVGEPENESQTYVIRIFTEDGEFVDFVPAKYITLDGNEPKIKTDNVSEMTNLINTLKLASTKISAVPNAGTTNTTLHQMVKYRINDDGKITYIDTLLTKDKTLATRVDMQPSDSVYFEKFTDLTTYTNGGTHIGSKYYATAATKVYLYHPSDKYEYGVVPGTTVYQSYIKASGYAFYSNEFSIFPDVYMKENDKQTSFNTMYTNYYAIIKKMTDTVDDEGMPAKKVYAYVNNSPVTFVTKETLAPDNVPTVPNSNPAVKLDGFSVKDLKEGDIITYSLDTVTGELSNYELIYRDGTLFAPPGAQASFMAYVYDVQDDGFIYVLADKISDIEAELIAGNYSSARLTSAAVTVYDKNEAEAERIKAGSLSDLYSYKDFKGDTSKISKILIHVYNTGYRRPVDIFILR